jgi:hypothetical protein
VQTALDILASCKSVAQSDYDVTVAKCIRVTDPAARKSCQRQAAPDLSDALDTCRGGFQVRKESCQKFEPDPHDLVIDPRNFTPRIDNSYFPLVPGTTFTYLTPDGAIVVPYGNFTNCLKSQETIPLEPDAPEDKYYAPGVGNVLTVDLVTGERDELVNITTE